MERCRADYDIKPALQRQVKKIAGDKMQASSEIYRQVLARRMQHVLREIDPDDVSMWKSFQQLGGEASGAATGVEDGLMPAEFQAGEDLLAPA
jgi:hypothetical protein